MALKKGDRVRYDGKGGYDFSAELKDCEGTVREVIGTDAAVKFDKKGDCSKMPKPKSVTLQQKYLTPGQCP